MSFYGRPPLAAAASQSLVKFGQRTRTVESNSSIPTTSARLLLNNPNRVEFVIVNLGNANVYLGLGSQVSVTNGIVVPPNGAIDVLLDEDGEVVAWDWWIVAASDTPTVYVQEVLAD